MPDVGLRVCARWYEGDRGKIARLQTFWHAETDNLDDEHRPMPSSSPPCPIATLRRQHARQLQVCSLLERLADTLPDLSDTAAIASANEALTSCFLSHMRFEDEQLFPRLRLRLRQHRSFSKLLDQLHHEHHRDEGAILEITEQFTTILTTGRCRNTDMLGYMLRGFFESQRSHIILEDVAVLPRAERILSAADLDGMRAWLSDPENR